MTLVGLANLFTMPAEDAYKEIYERFKRYMMDTQGVDVDKVAEGLRAFLKDVNKE